VKFLKGFSGEKKKDKTAHATLMLIQNRPRPENAHNWSLHASQNSHSVQTQAKAARKDGTKDFSLLAE
jgi:hypothetical protein